MKHFSHLFLLFLILCILEYASLPCSHAHQSKSFSHSGPENSSRELCLTITTLFRTVRLTIYDFQMTLNNISLQSIIYFSIGISSYNYTELPFPKYISIYNFFLYTILYLILVTLIFTDEPICLK